MYVYFLDITLISAHTADMALAMDLPERQECRVRRGDEWRSGRVEE
jgi:hypothetical protein